MAIDRNAVLHRGGYRRVGDFLDCGERCKTRSTAGETTAGETTAVQNGLAPRRSPPLWVFPFCAAHSIEKRKTKRRKPPQSNTVLDCSDFRRFAFCF